MINNARKRGELKENMPIIEATSGNTGISLSALGTYYKHPVYIWKILGQHKIEGIGDDFVPELLDRNKIDKIILINDDDAINMSRKLSRELGLGVGISSGANFLGSVLLTDDIKQNVITVFPDDNKKYLSTELSDEIDLNLKFISNKIELVSIDIAC